MAIIVREIEGGDFQVIKGGDVYRGRGYRVTPGTVASGETVSASEICEWVENGVEVESASTVTKAAFREYGEHHYGCATNDENRKNPAPCDCGFDKVRAAVSSTTAA